jgi:hypothetical protein
MNEFTPAVRARGSAYHSGGAVRILAHSAEVPENGVVFSDGIERIMIRAVPPSAYALSRQGKMQDT